MKNNHHLAANGTVNSLWHFYLSCHWSISLKYSMVQRNPNSDFILKATYPHCGKLCLTFGPNFGGLGTK
jgi:hypothetical protein